MGRSPAQGQVVPPDQALAAMAKMVRELPEETYAERIPEEVKPKEIKTQQKTAEKSLFD